MATGLVISRAFVRSDIFLEGYTWDGMGSLLEFAGAEAGGTPIVRMPAGWIVQAVSTRSF